MSDIVGLDNDFFNVLILSNHIENLTSEQKREPK